MHKNIMNSFCIGGVSSGAGKTVITLGLIKAFARRGLKVQPFKCGPDYIDTEFHTKAAKGNSYNLDTWMMGEDQVKKTYARNVQDADIGIVEGVMGLFDGVDSESLKGSTASVADILDIPIILIVNAKSMAQSIAAVVMGYNSLYRNIKITGVIANNVGSEKHKKLLQIALKKHGLPPLLGTIPKNIVFELSERHLGLTPDQEAGKSDGWYSELAGVIEQSIDMDLLLNLTEISRPDYSSGNPEHEREFKIGIAEDDAFHFYYKDNLNLLENSGFELIKFSPLDDERLPDNLDALYLGGGFPEMFIEQLSSNKSMVKSIRNFAGNKGVIFAECGGYIYLVDKFIDDAGKVFQMCGILEGTGRMTKKLQNFGYKEVFLDKECIFGPVGTTLKGHEFHWSTIDIDGKNENFVLTGNVKEDNQVEAGQVCGNVFASYIHLHFLSNPEVIRHFKSFIEKKSIKV